jgi:hypothetical protein
MPPLSLESQALLTATEIKERLEGSACLKSERFQENYSSGINSTGALAHIPILLYALNKVL